MREVFIIGSKGIPAGYGGFETFVENLTANKVSESLRYHVSCLASNNKEFKHNQARCFNVRVPNIGSAKAIYYDVMALRECIKYIKRNNIKNAIVYVLACRIGPFIGWYKKKLKKLGASLFVNPDGHEWKRAKWNSAIKAYWKFSEGLMVKHSDLLICDSINIENYIKKNYSRFDPKTIYIAYGADISKSTLGDKDYTLINWYRKHHIKRKEYYLVVGRFVPENNYELMIKEFMKSKSKKELVIITNVKKNKFYKELKEKTKFHTDDRIKFVGTIYNSELLKKVRENAYAYIHGHEVGGTNPSLLEALAATDFNLLFDVGFNREVAENGALYFNKEKGSLTKIIDNELDKEIISTLGKKAKNRITSEYQWITIVNRYEDLLLNYSKDRYIYERVKGSVEV